VELAGNGELWEEAVDLRRSRVCQSRKPQRGTVNGTWRCMHAEDVGRKSVRLEIYTVYDDRSLKPSLTILLSKYNNRETIVIPTP